MKAVILCGGKGTRMREETEYRPKPLVEIGGKPIIWHIMKIYSKYNINEFILCLGYKGNMIKEYFMNMQWINNDFTISIDNDLTKIEYHSKENVKWKITFVDTGIETLTAGRLKKIKDYIKEEEFLMTYGDGLSDVNIESLINFHKAKGKTATLTGVHPLSSFGILETEDGVAKTFNEKPRLTGLINGGFMILNKKVFDYIPKEDCMFEEKPLKNIAEKNQLTVFQHNGFWMAIDTVKDINKANELWNSGENPWKV